MDEDRLKKKALILKRLMEIYSADDEEVGGLMDDVAELIDSAIAGEIMVPVQWQSVPGEWYFQEGSLRKYKDLEDAYSQFKLELTDGETPDVKNLLNIIDSL